VNTKIVHTTGTIVIL